MYGRLLLYRFFALILHYSEWLCWESCQSASQPKSCQFGTCHKFSSFRENNILIHVLFRIYISLVSRTVCSSCQPASQQLEAGQPPGWDAYAGEKHSTSQHSTLRLPQIYSIILLHSPCADVYRQLAVLHQNSLVVAGY